MSRNKLYKDYEFAVKSRNESGGEIRITHSSVDRDGDIIRPELIDYSSWQAAGSPIFYSHQYSSPYSLVGAATKMMLNGNGITAKFKLRKPETAEDPQHVVRALWKQKLLNGASIGFRALEPPKKNDHGGLTFGKIEMLEFSLTPIPSQPLAISRSVGNLAAVAPLAKSIDGYRRDLVTGRAGGMTSAERRQMVKSLDELTALLPELARMV